MVSKPVSTQLPAQPAAFRPQRLESQRKAISKTTEGHSALDNALHRASQRALLATAAWALAALAVAPPAVAALEASAAAASSLGDPVASSAAQPAAAEEGVVPVYFGNGCFWGRQFDFVNTELRMGRSVDSVSAVAGYAGGRGAAPAGKVCYYRGPEGTVYEELGHAEVVQVDLRGDQEEAKRQYGAFAETYFSQFRKTPFGMMRLDPQDAGPGYRNVIGLPGGVNSPLFPVLQAANRDGMRLLPGEGNAFDAAGQPSEDDLFNTVWVVDTDKLPFNRAEQWHQFHTGIGKRFPKSYTVDMKERMKQAGKIDSTGCPEYFFN